MFSAIRKEKGLILFFSGQKLQWGARLIFLHNYHFYPKIKKKKKKIKISRRFDKIKRKNDGAATSVEYE